MRWLMIALLVSMGGLLLAAAGMARHILRQRGKLPHKPTLGNDIPEETDVESDL
jgi:hypothetical protein